MDANFWHERWQSGRIAFHEGAPNELMTRNFGRMGLAPGRIFVPLCGKAVDMVWLAAQGHEVIGAELDPLAVEAFYTENSIAPEVTAHGSLRRFSGDGITIYQGDIFELGSGDIGTIDAVFDRAALVALPPEMRRRYAAHLLEITAKAPQFLVTFEYSNPAMQGPPHSVPADEVKDHYSDTHEVSELERVAISGPLLNRTTGEEIAWQLTPR
ncbi:MAG: thiopurine S-methyltransferase [Pseudomonadota bacterium]